MPPTTVPPAPAPALEPFRSALQAYVDQTQPYRKAAAQAAEEVPGKGTASAGAEASVRTRQNVLAEALKTKLRPNAKQGQLFLDGAVTAIRREVSDAFNGPRHDLLMDALAEQNDTGRAEPQPVKINEHVGAPRVPPLLVEMLPPLPKQLEYSFAGRTLIVRDVDADVVVDYLPETLPELPPPGVPTVEPAPVGGAKSPLPMPSIRGGMVFALMGDSGSGDMPQQAVAQAMLTYFTTARRFPFVLMLGDNLYHDDYEDEFLVPYKALLDRGVTFHAALGNHDPPGETRYPLFHMDGRNYYNFERDAGPPLVNRTVEFIALDTVTLDEPQLGWLVKTLSSSRADWKVAYFHHPLYTSGRYSLSAALLRRTLEPIFVRYGVDVALNGHEHFYERIVPQRGVQYFTSGGGGALRRGDIRRSDLTAAGFDQDTHFMLIEIAGDTLYFQTVSRTGQTVDSGHFDRVRHDRPPPVLRPDTSAR
jgi:hypothetical protein